MEVFCREQDIEHELCGKVIVALNEEELPRMEKIFQRGQENGVNCEIIPRERLLEIEPHAAGVQAIHVPECGIVNYKQVCLRLGEIIQEKNGLVLLGEGVSRIESSTNEVIVHTPNRINSCLLFNQLCRFTFRPNYPNGRKSGTGKNHSL